MQIELDENDDLFPEYDLDYSKSKSNRFAENYARMVRQVGLAPDVADEFPTEESVNDALREYLRLTRKTIPDSQREIMLVDSHCHIDGEQFDDDRDDVVRRAGESGVGVMLNVGTGDPNSDDFRRAVLVAEKYENVYASVGVHPHDAKLYDDAAEQHLDRSCQFK